MVQVDSALETYGCGQGTVSMDQVLWDSYACVGCRLFLKTHLISGFYQYADDNTEKRKSLDVARISIRTRSYENLNRTIQVCINKVMFTVKLVKDWYGPLRLNEAESRNQRSTSPVESDLESSNDELCDNFANSGAEGFDGDDGEDAGNDQDRVEVLLKALNVNLDSR